MVLHTLVFFFFFSPRCLFEFVHRAVVRRLPSVEDPVVMWGVLASVVRCVGRNVTVATRSVSCGCHRDGHSAAGMQWSRGHRGKKLASHFHFFYFDMFDLLSS